MIHCIFCWWRQEHARTSGWKRWRILVSSLWREISYIPIYPSPICLLTRHMFTEIAMGTRPFVSIKTDHNQPQSTPVDQHKKVDRIRDALWSSSWVVSICVNAQRLWRLVSPTCIAFNSHFYFWRMACCSDS